MRSDIVAVIPAFDCAASIAAVVAGVRRHLERVVVVDDGSRDGTAPAAAGAGAEVECLERNRGKGHALRRGFELALAGEPGAVVLLDGDGQHDPDDLPRLVAPWERGEADLVIGARLEERGKIPGARYWTNYIGSRALSWMTGIELRDSQSGLRLLSADLLRRLRLVSEDYAIESEMLIKAVRLGARVAHVRVQVIYEGEPSHFRPLRDVLRISCAAIYFKVFDDL
jgi:glycosyltransferase involved in cell wall biosynthesis